MHREKKIFEFLLKFRKKRAKKLIEAKKNSVRKKIREQKEEITDAQKRNEAKTVFEKIELLPEFQNAKSILMYWSLDDELPTHDFIRKWSDKKQMLLPVVKNRHMLIMPFSKEKELVKGELGVWEPEIQREFMNKIDLVVAPGIAFDKKKSRMGRGKGYYDRYFVNKNIKKIGIGFDFQLLDEVPILHYDIKMDMIITASNSIE